MKKQYVICKKCGKTAKPDNTRIPHEVGTTIKMHCPSCADKDGRATMCRSCCPTGHGTEWE